MFLPVTARTGFVFYRLEGVGRVEAASLPHPLLCSALLSWELGPVLGVREASSPFCPGRGMPFGKLGASFGNSLSWGHWENDSFSSFKTQTILSTLTITFMGFFFLSEDHCCGESAAAT